LGVSPQQVLQFCAEGELCHYRRGHFFEFDLLDVQALKAARDLRPARRRGARSLREQLTTVLS